jgi:polar amino acid transport system substrate-binding protein
MKRRLFCTLTGATAVAGAMSGFSRAARAQDALTQMKANGVLRIGTEPAFAPFDFIDSSGKHVGFNLDLFAALGKDLGVKVTYTLLPFEGLLPGLEARRFDLIGGPLTITKARMERYLFLPPVSEGTVALLKRRGDSSITKPADIAGKTVGAGKASAQLAQLRAFTETLPGKTSIREYVGNNEAYADLAAGRIAAVGNSFPNVNYVATQRPQVFEVVTPPFGKKTYFGYLGRKDADSAPLLDVLQAALLKLRADGRLAGLQKTWIGQSIETPEAVTAPEV